MNRAAGANKGSIVIAVVSWAAAAGMFYGGTREIQRGDSAGWWNVVSGFVFVWMAIRETRQFYLSRKRNI
jgi:hypothetical protein